jgi:hypothetical protein
MVDATIFAWTFLGASLLVCAVGLVIVPDGTFDSDLASLTPLLVGVLEFLVIAFVVDPMLTPKSEPSREQVRVWLSKAVVCRLAAMEGPALVGLVTAVVANSRSPLVLGALGTLVLAVLWWPGNAFLNAMRRRAEPRFGATSIDDALTDGRLKIVRTRLS